MNTEHIADGPKGGHGVAEILSGTAPIESKDLGDTLEKAKVAELAKQTSGETLREPTDEEKHALRRVPGSIPAVSYVLCIAELAERASYYGASHVFNNFMQFPLPAGGDGSGAVPKNKPNGHAGALGRGLQFATAFSLLFKFLSYLFPILGAWIAEAKIGRFRAIMIGVFIGGVAHVIMIGGAAPSVLKAGNGLAPFLVSLFTLALGAGIFKPNVSPTVIDQYRNQREYVKSLASGESVIIDPESTIQRIMLIFYCCINVGAFFGIATTYAEKYVGFWCAFLLPGIVYFLLPIILLAVYKKLIIKPAMGSELTTFLRIVWTAVRRNGFKVWRHDFWAAASPSALAQQGVQVGWTERAVEDVKRTFAACAIFLYFPIYNINDGGIGAVGSNQGAAMRQDGAPNDLLSNFNPISIMVATPILAYGLFPLLARRKIRFGPVRRMLVGQLLAALSGVVAALVQWRVYETSPCGYAASTCNDVSQVNIWWQVPNVALGGISELFYVVTAYELAYARAPPHLKAVVMSIFLFMYALSNALAEILIPAIVDPHLIWVWAGPAVALFVQSAIFWLRHRKLDDEVYMLEQEVTQSEAHLSPPKEPERDPEKTS